MNLKEQSRSDAHDILTNSCDWGEEMTFTAPTGEVQVLFGHSTKHHLSIDEQGVPFNDRMASVAVSDASFTAAYPLYNTDGDVKLRKHKVKTKDSTGNEYTYMIKEWFPDRTLGLIVCILGDYK